MPTTPNAEPDTRPDESDMSRSYIAVLALEVVVILGLYWLGLSFG